VTAGGGDYTVHIVVGVDPEWRLYVLDLWRRQTSSDQWIEAFCDLVVQWKPIGWAEEQGQINAGVGPFLERQMHERRAYVARKQFPTRGDKAVRAQSIRGRMALDGLYVPIHAPWYPAFRSELLTLLGLIGQVLDIMSGGHRPRASDTAPIRGINNITMDELWANAPKRPGPDARI
jgi:predicted phage terminase large subunit-like protein